MRPQGFFLKMRGALLRSRAEREMDEEMRFHIDRETEKNMRAGFSRSALAKPAMDPASALRCSPLRWLPRLKRPSSSSGRSANIVS